MNFFEFYNILENQEMHAYLLLKWGDIQKDAHGQYIDFFQAGGKPNELSQIKPKTMVERLNGKFQVEKVDQQNGKVYLGKMILGQQIKHNYGVWQFKFSNVKKDNIEGYYYDWADDPGSVNDLEDVEVGDQIGDHALNMTPYWKVTYVDQNKSRIYVDPISPNPLAFSGKIPEQDPDDENPVISIGAGGMPIRQNDLKVLTGEHEQEQANYYLDKWKKGQAYGPQDIAYLLLGTVPTNFGPNGPQGGWYNIEDVRSNRGGKKDMSAKEIMMSDAKTLRNTFHFQVPIKALSGELDPHLFTQFVNGGVMDKDKEETLVDGENFNDLKSTINMVLTAKEPSLKSRNAEVLFDRFYTGFSEYKKTRYNDPDHEEAEKKWKAGGYTNKELESVMKMVALQLAKITHPTAKGEFDPYYLTKEKFIYLASKLGWDDVLKAYENTSDSDNRRKVFDAYAGTVGSEKGPYQPDKMMRMFKKETAAENIARFLPALYKAMPDETLQYLEDNDLSEFLNDKSYGSEVKRTIDAIRQRQEYKKKYGDKSPFGDW